VKSSPSVATARRALHPVRTLLGLYLLGGVAPLALRIGPRQFAWAAMWIVSLTGWVTLAWFREPVQAMMTSARLPILPFLVALVAVHLVGLHSWSRGIARTVRDPRFVPEMMPAMLRNKWVAIALGTVFPGFGLATAGRGVRAGVALWNAGQVLFAGLVLWQAGLLWSWNAKEGVDALPKTFVEGIFLTCVAIVVIGGLLWIASALEGARVQLRAKAAPVRRFASGDLVAAGLVVSLVAFGATFRPNHVAHDLDAFASSMRFSGYRMIPLVFESTAATLDSGRPEYMMRVAELHAEMGRTQKAQVIHDRLRERWEAYASMLLQTSSPDPAAAEPGRPIQPVGDLVPRAPELSPSLAAGVGPALPATPAP
jgi:hypothetical protein